MARRPGPVLAPPRRAVSTKDPERTRTTTSRKTRPTRKERPIDVESRSGSSRDAAVVSLQERRAAKAWRRWGTMAAVLAAIGAVVWLLGWSPYCRVTTVDVRGVSRVSPVQVQSQTDLLVGQPMVMLDSGFVEERVSHVPGVLSAQVWRRWPSTVVVEVVERAPFAVVPAGGQGFAIVDDEGVVLENARSAPKDLPLIHAPLGPGLDRRVSAAVTALHAFPARLRPQVTSVTAKTVDTVRFELSSGRVVQWGDGAKSAEKAQAVLALMENPQAKTIDVSTPDAPMTRP